VAQPAGVGALGAEAHRELGQQDAAGEQADPVLHAGAVEEQALVIDVRRKPVELARPADGIDVLHLYPLVAGLALVDVLLDPAVLLARLLHEPHVRLEREVLGFDLGVV
jgi:hypothetical protein